MTKLPSNGKNNALHSGIPGVRLEAWLKDYREQLKNEDNASAIVCLEAVIRASGYSNKKLIGSLEELSPPSALQIRFESCLKSLLQQEADALTEYEGLIRLLSVKHDSNFHYANFKDKLNQLYSVLHSVVQKDRQLPRQLPEACQISSTHRPSLCLVLPFSHEDDSISWLHSWIKQSRTVFCLHVAGRAEDIERCIHQRGLTAGLEAVIELESKEGITTIIERVAEELFRRNLHILAHPDRLFNPLSAVMTGAFPDFFHVALNEMSPLPALPCTVAVCRRDLIPFYSTRTIAAPGAVDLLAPETAGSNSPRKKAVSVSSSLTTEETAAILKELSTKIAPEQRPLFIIEDESLLEGAGEEIRFELSEEAGSVRLVLGDPSSLMVFYTALTKGQEVWWYRPDASISEVPDLSPCMIISDQETLRGRLSTVANRKYRHDAGSQSAFFKRIKEFSATQFSTVIHEIESAYLAFLAEAETVEVKSTKTEEPAPVETASLHSDPFRFIEDVPEMEENQLQKLITEELSTLDSPEEKELLIVAEKVDPYDAPFLCYLLQELAGHSKIRLLCAEYNEGSFDAGSVDRVRGFFNEDGAPDSELINAINAYAKELSLTGIFCYHPQSPLLLTVLSDAFPEARLITELSDSSFYSLDSTASDWSLPLKEACDYIITPTSRIEEFCKKIDISESHILPLPVGVPLQVKRLETETAAISVVSPIRFEREEAPFLVMKAFEQAVGMNPLLKLELIGIGALIDAMQLRLQKMVIPPESVIITETESLEYVQEKLSTADIFLHHPVPAPGSEEAGGVSFPLLQAMAYGLPIISTTLDPIVEAFSAKDSGLLVPPFDAGAVTSALLSFAKDRAFRKNCGEQARLQALARYDLGRRAKQITSSFGVDTESMASHALELSQLAEEPSAGKNLANAFNIIGKEQERTQVKIPLQLNEKIDDSLKKAVGRRVEKRSRKGTSNDRDIKQRVNRAILLLQEGESSKALGILNEVSLENSSVSDLHFTRALCLIELNDIHAAREALEQELSTNPDHEAAGKLLGEVNREIRALQAS